MRKTHSLVNNSQMASRLFLSLSDTACVKHCLSVLTTRSDQWQCCKTKNDWWTSSLKRLCEFYITVKLIGFIPWYDIGTSWRVPYAEQEMLTLPEHLISPLVFIEVHVVLSSVSPYFMWYISLVFWILSFDCSFCLIAWYLYFYFCIADDLCHKRNILFATILRMLLYRTQQQATDNENNEYQPISCFMENKVRQELHAGQLKLKRYNFDVNCKQILTKFDFWTDFLAR